MTEEQFRLAPEDIRPNVAPGRGSCIATDMITVSGLRVGYMYRTGASSDIDSGWRFFAGTEPQEYVDDPANMAIYDVNTIANYDPEIVPLLDAPVGAAYERDSETGEFVDAPFPDGDDVA